MVAWGLFAVAAGCFVFGQVYFSERTGVWSEEVSTYPTGPSRAVDLGPGGGLRFEECGDEVRLRTSTYRPELAVCAAGRTWPVMGATYYSTWVYWPFGAVLSESIFALRKVGIAIGFATLLMAFLIAARMTDPLTAAAGAIAASLSSAFVLPHSLLVHFELLQLPLVVLAATGLATAAGDRRLSRGRAAAIGLSAGLALAVNVKAVFLLGALGLVLWKRGRLALLEGEARRVLLVAAALPLGPMVAFGLMDPESGISSQVVYRLENIGSRIASGTAFLEPLNALRFWTDVAAYGDQAAGMSDGATALLLVFPALALGRITMHFVQAMRGRDHELFAASLGALVCVYIVVAALLWDQAPAANYAPLHVVFGVATGTSAVAFARLLAARFAWPAPVLATLAATFVLASAGGFAYHTYRRGDPGRLAISTNATAQRALVAHLETAPGGTVVTASYNLAGVIDAVSGGRVRATRVETYLTHCGDVAEADLGPCVTDHLGRLVEEVGRLRLIAPARHAVSDEAGTALIAPALDELARRGAIHFEIEASFAGVSTGPVLTLWDVHPL